MSVIDLSALTGGLRELPPLALYVHFPWCIRKCPYCDFNSHEPKNGFDEMAYVDALLRDLEFSLPEVWGRPLTSIFMGGGTPSLFSPQAMDAFLAGVRARMKLHPDAEITMEANPGTFEIERFRGYREAGINRLSIGIQSFDPKHLQALGRIHDGDEAKRAVEIALSHFDNVNLDLMYALPGQTLDQALSDLNTALSYGITHLSAYHLTIEPNTMFAAQTPKNLPDDEVSADMQEAIESRLASAGFDHYETSAFAKPGRHSRHNLNYWQFGDYVGIGAGAHGKISSHAGIVRQMRHKQPAAYLKAVADGAPLQSSQKVARADLPFEFMMNLLRLTGGFESRLFQERTGLPLASIRRQLDEAQAQGLLDDDGAILRPTLKGQRFLNDLLTLFLKEGDE
ncbi:oxygen-independent coproporphyrinogen III oxidase-like protein [Chromobacterium subtsugae]|uniref:Heme chaperone HemW n=1 Tax=Chromobacterium subtsugae TaxID=251747 RepID=A0ABS7FEA9_9NEIS|nr:MULTISPECIES: radical SAM family heme chaperone HemW [Chromobacterium]KUM04201.1 coproporphyrinogen III oxidase [Chromobacterium subtsugae]KZE85698.1 YggW family oxidoreductase [Chromobacterium sp. F49]MBW7566326.1 oxygen-independent coproporphyrinogen III oxidase-like protein [Chromobacterium subtsugae]MBW8287815.1 oxygen-independent coproporphyrinogen III oxidase-like protein [Chromobacterium subtsugae]WSE91144.1 radical SAM family heme chaperone HemW [Chromobacterium subtsugae]